MSNKTEYCEKCAHTGLIPFIKNGRVIPNVHLFCECNPQSDGCSQPYSHQYTSDMFDYPMSYSFYRMLCREHGWEDSGPDYQEETQILSPIKQQSSNITKSNVRGIQHREIKLPTIPPSTIQHSKQGDILKTFS
jgi:hypothetical protein